MDSMRTQYSRYLKSPPSGSGGHHTPRQEWFLRRLKFLELHMKKRPSTSNLDVQNVSLFTDFKNLFNTFFNYLIQIFTAI